MALEVPPQEEVTTTNSSVEVAISMIEEVPISKNHAEVEITMSSEEVAIPKDPISKNNVVGVATSKNAEVDNLMRDEVATSTNSVGVVAILNIEDLPERGMSSLKDRE